MAHAVRRYKVRVSNEVVYITTQSMTPRGGYFATAHGEVNLKDKSGEQRLASLTAILEAMTPRPVATTE